MAVHPPSPTLPAQPAAAIMSVWTGRAAVRLAHGLLAAALFLLFLNATATVEAGFTVQLSYVCAVLAVTVGLPVAVAGWLVVPRTLQAAAGFLLAVHVVMSVAGSDAGLPTQQGRSTLRDVVYLFDLTVGLLLIGLAVGCVRRGASIASLLLALAGGLALGAGYALYQWFALRYGLPLSDVNTAVNSDGFSRGHRHQGVGLLGWERVRGTFREPLYLATYLAVTIPVAAALAGASAGWRRGVLGLVTALASAALLLTVSVLTWGAALAIAMAALLLGAVATGRRRTAGFFGAALTVVVLSAPVAFTNPSIVAGLTGRSGTDLQLTSGNRTKAWERAARVWSEKPVFGHGVGQSAVRLSYRPDGGAIAPGLRAPVVLGSAQGLWAASLIDVGLVGLTAWLLLFAAVVAALGAAVLARPTAMRVALFHAGGLSIALTQLSGDRVDLRVWLVLALGLALACQRRGPEAADRRQESEQPAVQP